MMRSRVLVAFVFFLIPVVAISGENCRDCHTQKGMPGFVDPGTFSESVHGAFPCTQCHLGISPYPHGRVAKVQCGICHFLGRNGAPKEEALEYKMSVHNHISPVGQNRVPSCQTCHGSHYIFRSSDRRSATRREHIPVICSPCHPREYREYGASIHGIEAIDRHNTKAPTCFDCHQEHMIPPTGAATWMLSLIKECGSCHSEQLKTYRKTYHGKVTELGYTTIAKCSDCHGSHRITRVADSASVLSEQNIVHTCSKCHPGATPGFTRFYAHADETNRTKYPVLYYTYLFMTVLLIGVFAFFITHTFLWAYRSLKERMNKKDGG
jgi:hypothetical protein